VDAWDDVRSNALPMGAAAMSLAQAAMLAPGQRAPYHSLREGPRQRLSAQGISPRGKYLRFPENALNESAVRILACIQLLAEASSFLGHMPEPEQLLSRLRRVQFATGIGRVPTRRGAASGGSHRSHTRT